MLSGEAIVARARALAGTRFRAQGRDRAQGVDCIGLVALAAEVPLERVRGNYWLRGGSAGEVEQALSALGFESRAAEPERGDILVMEAGPAQLHLAVFTGSGLIHADAGLRMVVERPGPIPWPVLGAWRAAGDS
jgi:cell wall-associated NlpC family hydrolase